MKSEFEIESIFSYVLGLTNCTSSAKLSLSQKILSLIRHQVSSSCYWALPPNKANLWKNRAIDNLGYGDVFHANRSFSRRVNFQVILSHSTSFKMQRSWIKTLDCPISTSAVTLLSLSHTRPFLLLLYSWWSIVFYELKAILLIFTVSLHFRSEDWIELRRWT